jgi:heat-inducible transcriptional repressor
MEITRILAAIVREYSATGSPVGSTELRSKYHFDVSSATIRNEMKALEGLGLVTHPHTSAGRIPTDEGYRFFVNKLMKHLEITQAEQARLNQELRRLQKQYLELGHSLTRLLASQSQGAAFALLPEGVSTTGLSNVIDERMNADEIKEVAKFLENVSEHGSKLVKKDFEHIQTFIGKESPIPLSPDFSLMVTKVSLPRGEQGVVGIIGPKRMRYAKNISLLEYVRKMLSSGLPILIIYTLSS